MEAFLKALEDDNIRNGLAGRRTELPENVIQLVDLINDQNFRNMANHIVQDYRDFIKGRKPLNEVQAAGMQLNDYLSTSYPVALQSLTDYAHRVASEIRLPAPNEFGTVFAGANIAAYANAAIVANAFVYANAAVATLAAVAAAAVLVAVVTVPTTY